MKKVYHLSLDSRRRLINLRNVILNLLNEDRKFGFSSSDLSSLIGPSLYSVLSLVWCKPLRGVLRPFRPVNSLDRFPFVVVPLDVHEHMINESIRLSEENKRFRLHLGLKDSDELPF